MPDEKPVVFSQWVSTGKAAIAHVQERVRYRGLNTAGGWIRNTSEYPNKFGARIYQKILGLYRDSQSDGSFDARTYIEQVAKLGIDSQTGNCSELSAIAFLHLEKMGIAPIDYVAAWRGSWNHAFVLLNRDASQPISDFAAWSRYAVVCDPLYDRAADAGYLPRWYPRLLPLREKDVILRIG